MKSKLAVRIAKMREDGKTWDEVARAFGDLSPSSAWNRLHRPLPTGKTDDCHGDCGRWVDPYLVGQQIVAPPDYCGGCARAISPQAIADEAQRVRGFLHGAMQASENGESE